MKGAFGTVGERIPSARGATNHVALGSVTTSKGIEMDTWKQVVVDPGRALERKPQAQE